MDLTQHDTNSCRIEDLSGTPAIRVGFETTGVYTTQAGVARYVRGLQRGFEQTRPKGIDLFPIAWEVENFAYRQPQRAIKTMYRELFWGKVLAPRILHNHDANILHSTSSLFIRCPGDVKHVITLHDMSISRHPERFRKWQVSSWNRRLANVQRADRVLCISQFTADEAMKMLGLSALKIDVVHNGCDWHEDEIMVRESKPDFAVPAEFFLFVGSLEPGKNLKLLKEAYLLAQSRNRRLAPLMIVGARWQGVATEGDQPQGWIYLGRQPDEVLLYLYRRAVALVFPSIYEGFGLPLVEAMAQGCPVICSPTSSLPEVAGDAALMVELQASRYVDAMRELMKKPEVRRDLIARGKERARRFSWKRCAEETVQTYHKAMDR
ncbi:MAG TPA: glycosyltransferase family 1 protein [Tepidisphaeraceae bacterium]|jgi:alpha-1,3-rhamnosyl/mannosyltransferase